MKRFVTLRALSVGIELADVEMDKKLHHLFYIPKGWDARKFVGADFVHEDEISALVHAENMRAAKIAELERKIQRLREKEIKIIE